MRKFLVHLNGDQKVLFQSGTAIKCRGIGLLSSPNFRLRRKRPEGLHDSTFPLGEFMLLHSHAEQTEKEKLILLICGSECSC